MYVSSWWTSHFGTRCFFSLARHYLSQANLFLLSATQMWATSHIFHLLLQHVCACVWVRPKSIIQHAVQLLYREHILNSDLRDCWREMFIPASNLLQGQQILLCDPGNELRNVSFSLAESLKAFANSHSCRWEEKPKTRSIWHGWDLASNSHFYHGLQVSEKWI